MRRFVLYEVPLLVLHTKSTISFHFGAWLEAVFEIEQRAACFGLLRAKVKGPYWHAKMGFILDELT